MGKYIERNLGGDEHIINTIKVHGMILLPHIVLMFILVGFITIIPAIITLCTTELGFTNKKLLGKVGLINTKTLDAPLNKINNASVSSGLGGKIFGYGTIHITTSSGSYLFKGISRPNDFKTSLMSQIDQYDEDRIKRQATEMANAMKG